MHYMLYVSAAVFDTVTRELLTLIPVGRPEDNQLASRRREQREMRNRKEPCRESFRGPVGAWQIFTERNSGNTLREAAERLQPPSERDPEGRQRGDVPRAMPTVWGPVAARPSDHFGAGFGDAAQQPHSVHINREPTSRDRTPLLPFRALEHDDAGHAAAESLLGMLDVQDDFRAQSGRVRRAPGGPGVNAEKKP